MGHVTQNGLRGGHRPVTGYSEPHPAWPLPGELQCHGQRAWGRAAFWAHSRGLRGPFVGTDISCPNVKFLGPNTRLNVLALMKYLLELVCCLSSHTLRPACFENCSFKKQQHSLGAKSNGESWGSDGGRTKLLAPPRMWGPVSGQSLEKQGDRKKW